MNTLDDSNVKPSEVSARILSEHALLRPILRETEYLAQCLAKGKDEALEPLRAFALMLYEKFVAHIELENRILAPAVRQIIGWGPLLHEKMLEEHARQREHLQSDITELKKGTMSSVDVAASIGGFVEDLMRDMDAEERELLLRPDLLDDSPLSDGESG